MQSLWDAGRRKQGPQVSSFDISSRLLSYGPCSDLRAWRSLLLGRRKPTGFVNETHYLEWPKCSPQVCCIPTHVPHLFASGSSLPPDLLTSQDRRQRTRLAHAVPQCAPALQRPGADPLFALMIDDGQFIPRIARILQRIVALLASDNTP